MEESKTKKDEKMKLKETRTGNFIAMSTGGIHGTGISDLTDFLSPVCIQVYVGMFHMVHDMAYV